MMSDSRLACLILRRFAFSAFSFSSWVSGRAGACCPAFCRFELVALPFPLALLPLLPLGTPLTLLPLLTPLTLLTAARILSAAAAVVAPAFLRDRRFLGKRRMTRNRVEPREKNDRCDGGDANQSKRCSHNETSRRDCTNHNDSEITPVKTKRLESPDSAIIIHIITLRELYRRSRGISSVFFSARQLYIRFT